MGVGGFEFFFFFFGVFAFARTCVSVSVTLNKCANTCVCACLHSALGQVHMLRHVLQSGVPEKPACVLVPLK